MVTEARTTTGAEVDLVSKMYKDINSWASWSFVLGILSLVFFGQLDLTWGILLIATAALSWKTKIPHMFRLYAVVLGWAAVSNVLICFTTGAWGWSILAVLQLWWAVATARQYRKYRQLPLAYLYQSGNWPAKLRPPQDEGVILGRFAKASVLITLLMFILFSIACIGLVIYGVSLASQGVYTPETEVSQPPGTAVTQPSDGNQSSSIFDGFLSIIVFALALGTAALVHENPRRDLALVGVIINSVILALGFALIVIASLAIASGIIPNPY